VSCPTLKIRIQKDRSRVYRNDDVCAVEFNSFVLRDAKRKCAFLIEGAKISLALFISVNDIHHFSKKYTKMCT